MNTYSLSELAEFTKFRHNTSIRDTIYADRGLDGIAEFLAQHSKRVTNIPLINAV